MWDNLKASIASVVRTNNNQEITGENLQNVLNTIVNTVGANATFAGIAVPSTNPGTPDGPTFWLVGQGGQYSNFNNTAVSDGTLGVFLYDNSTWTFTEIINIASISGGIYNLIENNHSSAMSLTQAIQLIPTNKYRAGLHIIFNESGVGVVEYQFMNASVSNITTATYWEAIPHVESAEESLVTNKACQSTADLDIVDDDNNVIARFENGHVKTKYFDSSKVSESLDGTNSDLDIVDDNGYVLARFKNGHFRVKNFNSKYCIDNWFKGKTVAIMGDSISTNGNTGIDRNVPEMTITSEDVGKSLSAYLTYYDVNAGLSLGGHTFTTSEIGTEVTFTPVAGDVGKSIGLPANYNQNTMVTWWEVAASKLDFTPIPVCWSGSSITTHDLATSYNIGSNAHKMDCSYAWHESQIRKCGIRTIGTMARVAPDAIIIYRGTNDFSHTSNVALTDDFFASGTLTYPQTDALENNLFGYKEGLVITINTLREAYPFARIYLCTMNTFKRINYSNPPVNNGRNTLPQWNNAIREVADYMGCGLIEFDKDGITYENIYPTYANDSATTPTHPNNDGHMLMGERAIKDLLNN